MKTSKLTFKRVSKKKDANTSSENKIFIDFLIDNISLSTILDVGSNIGKFGWKRNIRFELKELDEIKNMVGSRLENNLYSLYVCDDCGDEGCGAVLINIVENKNFIEWNSFCYGDGLLPRGEDEKIDISPIYFDKTDYKKSLIELEILIKE